MKLLLVQPPIEDFYNTPIRSYPLGLIYLATKVKDFYEVKIVDLRKGKKPKKSENPFQELSQYYKEDTYSPFSLFRRYGRYGLAEETIESLIKSEKPDVLCISSLFSAYVGEVIRIAKMAKKIKGDMITICGGHNATAVPHVLLREGCIDYVIRGEGETPLLELLCSLENRRLKRIKELPGLCFRENGEILVSTKINFESEIDFVPHHGFVYNEDYLIGKKRYAFVITSRGCPYKCSFCSRMPVPYRERSLASVESEIEALRSLGIEWIDLEDDMLLHGKKRFIGLLNIFKGKGLTLSAMNGIYMEGLTSKLLKDMVEAGFKKINLSLVDVSPCVVKRQGRRFPKDLHDTLSRLESSELQMEIHFIVGLPNQKLEDVLKTMVYLSEKRCLLGPSVFYLTPGDPNVENVLGSDWTEKLHYMRSSVLLPANPFFSRNSLFTLLKLSRFINFVKRLVDSAESKLNLRDVRLSDELDDQILKTLLKEKRFIAYDVKKNEFFEEPQERDIVETFFRLMRGKKIKGYKTANCAELGDE
ncbi:MAG: cobalamin-dependent protein [Deltaproteobacteria bacterium]|nr:cobalamin-dependent protein [Deltaproteobacteria bacterium]